VFNRYGQKVFVSTGYDVEWDGYFNGSVLPIGTYYYIIIPKNGRKTLTGSVSIIR
jgi:gliding motility-associated-like protein